MRKAAAYLSLHGSKVDDGRSVATPPGVPIKPAWIAAKEIASEKWDETIAELQEIPGLLSTLDGDALSLYCDAWQQFHDAQALVAAQGMVCQSEKGGTYQHPAVGIANKARAEITKLGSMFGLNPTAREGMIVSGRTEDDELADLIR
jgi:P27 family predicted phage terminase small subunit